MYTFVGMMHSIKRAIPNLLTAGNLVGGILAIIFALTGKIELAPYCIFISAIFDFLDGFAARLLKVQNELGKQLDSLADMVTFGVAPGIIMLIILRESFINYHVYDNLYEDTPALAHYIVEYGPYFALVIPIFALFRLAKFNLDTRQSSSFIGLPTPAMTVFFAVLPILALDFETYTKAWKIWTIEYVFLNPTVLIALIVIMSVLMVSEIPLFALKFKNFKWTGNEVRFIFLTISIVLFATLLFWSIPLIIILYLILSIINNALKTKNEV